MSLFTFKNIAMPALLLTLILSLAACGGNKKSKMADGSVPEDMTRPPVVITGAERGEAESNPDETVSFEKWKGDREAKEKAKAKDE